MFWSVDFVFSNKCITSILPCCPIHCYTLLLWDQSLFPPNHFIFHLHTFHQFIFLLLLSRFILSVIVYKLLFSYHIRGFQKVYKLMHQCPYNQAWNNTDVLAQLNSYHKMRTGQAFSDNSISQWHSDFSLSQINLQWVVLNLTDFFQKYDLEKHDQNPVSSTRTGIITDTVAYCKAV